MSTQPVFRVISIGDLVVDIVLSIPHLPVQANQHQPAREIRLEPGGAGNFLIAGARLGMEMVALGVIGDDAGDCGATLGNAILSILQQEGIQVQGVVRQPDTTSTTVVVLVDQDGQNVFLGGYGVGPEIDLPGKWVEEIYLRNTAQAVFASGYTLAEKRDSRAGLELMALAREKNIPVFFDPGPEMVHATVEQIQAALANSEVLLLTEEEIPFMAAGEEGLSAARRLLEQGPRLVCVKRGPKGCTLLTAQETIEYPGFIVPARDPTGAGDSFAAAFIYAYLRKWELHSIAAFANAMGAAKVQKFGSGRQVPTAGEVRAILSANHVAIDF